MPRQTTFEKAVERFEQAVRDHALIGTQTNFEVMEAIEIEYEEAKHNLRMQRKL